MANRLKGESSPYLQQHAENPVDWYPGGEEALTRARQEDKPILLSIGYAACHWCHVMAHESFENPDTARVMNENFVSIKVDREERPDLDSIYMDAVQAMTGSGGWPLTVFLTPDGKPFYGGTYFPPADRFGLPGFRRLLREISAQFHNRRQDIETIGDHMVSQLRQSPVEAAGKGLGAEAFDQAMASLKRQFDGVYGGFGNQPKFPQPMIVDLLLRLARRGASADALGMAETTLIQMAAGGMYDQLGGGFHRYSVDRQWTVPHFEKMLYDNALLARLYVHAYQLTGKDLYRRVAVETLDYVLREMRSPEGGFYASQDADTEGREGAFYVWTPAEVNELLGAEDGSFARRYFGITTEGNFEHENILTRRVDEDALASELKMSPLALAERVEQVRGVLFDARQKRPSPGVDTKIIAGWNGLMMAAFAAAGACFGRDDYVRAAADNARYLRQALMADGRLFHTADPRAPRVEGFLQDYAFVTEGLLALYRATLEGEWLRLARQLVAALPARFWSEGEAAFFDTGSDHEALVVRPRNLFDNAIPAGGSSATLVLQHLAAVEGNVDYRRIAEASLAGVGQVAASNPQGFAYWLCALDVATAAPTEVAIVGEPADPATKALLAVVNSLYLPNLVVVGQEGAEGSPLLEARPAVDGRPTAYYCENFVCLPETTEPSELRRLLEGQRS